MPAAKAYESPIESKHFQKYKTTTLAMAKSLRLVDMEEMDAETMPSMFERM
jgi:hypothetical protein